MRDVDKEYPNWQAEFEKRVKRPVTEDEYRHARIWGHPPFQLKDEYVGQRFNINSEYMSNAMRKEVIELFKKEKEVEKLEKFNKERDEECVVCLDASAEMTCVPCNHTILCRKCAHNISKSNCPLCLTVVTNMLSRLKIE